jgi:hypothetical protein
MRFFRVRVNINAGDPNGQASAKLHHPFRLTGLQCNSCNQTWASFQTKPFICPDSIRPLLTSRSGPLPGPEHRQLQATCRRAFATAGVTLPQVLPGWQFPPSITGVWKYVPTDFLADGMGSLIVSQRFAEHWRDMNWTGATMFPTTVVSLPKSTKVNALSNIGCRLAEESTVLRLNGTVVDETYFELVVTGESQRIWPEINRCDLCGYSHYRPAGNPLKPKLTLTQEQWNGEDFFLLAPTRTVIVTEGVKSALDANGLRGFTFEEVTT